MTTKEKVISVIQTLSDDASLDDVIDRLYLLRKVERGIAQADAGDFLEHDAFMDELEKEDCLERVLKRGLTLWKRVDFIGFLASPERVRPLFKTRS